MRDAASFHHHFGAINFVRYINSSAFSFISEEMEDIVGMVDGFFKRLGHSIASAPSADAHRRRPGPATGAPPEPPEMAHHADFPLSFRFLAHEMSAVMADAAPVGLGFLARDSGAILAINRAGAAMLGLAANQAIGRRAGDFPVHATERRRLTALLKAEGALNGVEMALRPTSGPPFRALIGVRPARFQGQDLLVASLTGIDGPGRRERRFWPKGRPEDAREPKPAIDEGTRDLVEARDSAERANQIKSEYLSRMSPELRAPLDTILGHADMISALAAAPPAPAPRIGDHAESIRDAGRTLLALITGILDLAKLEAGRMDIAPRWLDAGGVCRDALSRIDSRAARAGVTLHLAVQRGAPLWADPQAVNRMLLDLLSNAVKFTASGGHAILSARTTADGGTLLAVADNGRGIPPDKVGLVFSPYERGDTQLDHEGAGIGLALVKGLIDLHRGRVEIASDPGVGTTVALLFPRPASVR